MKKRRKLRNSLKRKDLISWPMSKLNKRKFKEMLFCKLKEMKNLQSLKLIAMLPLLEQPKLRGNTI
jgi:hypothetical protein